MSTLVERGSHDAQAVLTPRPGRGRTELRLTRQALAALGAVTVPVVAVAAALNGAAGALGALCGAGLVAVLFGGGGVAQALAARRATSSAGVLLAGLGARLLVYIVALQLLGQVASLHRPSLAIATATAFVVTLHHELRLLSRTPQLFWVDPGARSGAPAPARSTR